MSRSCLPAERARLAARGLPPLAFVLTLLVVELVHPSRASAHAWMIRHGYTGCAACHLDPSGGGLLTPYGRAQGTLLMSERWGTLDDEDTANLGQFLFGAAPLPSSVSLGGDVRAAALVTSVDGQAATGRVLLMQADVGIGVNTGRFRSQATLGFASSGAFAAAIVGGDNARLVSRTHWVGVDLGADRRALLRIGRINVLFGIRSIEHTLFARRETHTDVNVSQQHGVSLTYTGEKIRGELMAILGNYQIRPDRYRERGYSGFLEYAPTEHLAFGASSLLTHAAADLSTQNPVLRQAHGGFIRYSPAEWLVLSAEADYLRRAEPHRHTHGLAAYAQADFQLTDGLHLIGTLECDDNDTKSLPYSYAGWTSVAWFFAPHADLRIDGVLQSIAVPSARVRAEALVFQLHFYL